jgi:hypothetical protein
MTFLLFTKVAEMVDRLPSLPTPFRKKLAFLPQFRIDLQVLLANLSNFPGNLVPFNLS